MKQDEFGNRMKAYEDTFTGITIDPAKWMAVRIDGKGFSKFTKSFKKPFDVGITSAMVETTKRLVEETHASVGYTQSDEITLLYPPTDTERMFGGKISKINSVFASIATANFNVLIQALAHIPVSKLAYFDCRVWEVPSDIEASNVLLWRAQDARKNSISSLFRWTAGPKLMENLNGKEMISKLETDFDVSWDKIPNEYKYGTYLKPVKVESYLTPEEIEKIPEHKRPDSLLVTRRQIRTVDMAFFGDLTLEQRVNFIG